MEMLDKFLYKYFNQIDRAIAFVETYAIKVSEWCWKSRVNLLHHHRNKK
jgi:hypothetical protein